MNSDDENPIPTHDPKKTLSLVVGIGLLLLALMVGLIVSINKPKFDQTQTSLTNQSQAQIEITKDGFIPATLKVPKGTIVTWINKDDAIHHVASNPHPEHDGLKGFDSKGIIGADGGSYSYTFNNSGEFTYHDHLNPTTNGTIVVE